MSYLNTVENQIEKQFYALGTLNHIKIFGTNDEESLNASIYRVLEIEQRMSAYDPNSDVSGINKCAGRAAFKIHKDTMEVLDRALEIWENSGEAFDITIRPLVELWGIGKKDNFVPCDEDIEATLRLIDSNCLLLDKVNNKASLKYVGQSIDLGGIAKGYAADEVKRILVEFGVENGLINLGGNIVVFGESSERNLFKIGIQNPLSSRGEYIGVLSVTDKTIVTSAVNERFFIKDGVQYHHILSPYTGKPSKMVILSVTAVGESSIIADAITTAIFVLGLSKGMALANKYGVELICITDNLDVLVSEGLREHFNMSIPA